MCQPLGSLGAVLYGVLLNESENLRSLVKPHKIHQTQMNRHTNQLVVRKRQLHGFFPPGVMGETFVIA